MHLNLFAISELLVIATFAPIAFYIFPKKGLLTKIFALFLFSVSLWGLGGFILMFVSNANHALIIFKFAAAVVFLIPAFFYHSILLLTKKQKKTLLILFYMQAIIFFILTLTGYVITSTRYVFNSFYWGIGIYPIYHLAFVIWLLIAILTHTELITYYKECYPKEKGQIRLLMWAILGYLGGTQNYLLTMGFNLYPYGNLLVPMVGL